MKKLLFAILYLAVLFLWVLPPVFVSPLTGITEISIQFSLKILANILCGTGLLFVKKELYPAGKKLNVLQKHAYVLTGFGALLLVSAVFELAGFILKKYGFEIAESKVLTPAGILQWFSLGAAVFGAAFFEEVIYRFYLPEAGIELSNGRFRLFWEIFSVVIFALGHRYLGLLAVFNGLCCGVILRILFKKSCSIWMTTGIHAVYNFMIFIVSAVS